MNLRIALGLLVGSCVAGACGDDTPRGAGDAVDAGDAGDASAEATDALHYLRTVFAGVHAGDASGLVAWYGDTLGMSAKGEMWFGLEDYSSLEIFDGGQASTATKPAAQQSIVVALQVPDLDAAVSQLEARGVRFVGQIEGEAGIDRWRWFVDAEGNRGVLKELGGARAGLAFESLPWVGIYVERFEETRDWYADVLGLHMVATGGTDPQWAHFLLGDGSYVELFSGGTAQPSKKNGAQQAVGFGLEVEDLEQAMATLESRSVQLDGELQEWITPGWPTERGITVIDPEGNAIGIKDTRPAP